MEDMNKRISTAVERAQMEAKMKAEEGAIRAPQGLCGEPVNQTPYLTGKATQRKYTRAEVHDQAATGANAEYMKNMAAAAFFRSHPEFEEFLDLIKAGAITLY